MPKRKRTVADTVQNKLEKYRIDIFRALSSAKVHERKRFSNKLHEPGITVAKKTRLEREYAALKALDLRQTARHHLHSNLLRIKAVETSKDTPEELRAEVPWPALSPEEISIRNNVISILCNAGPVRQALDRAVADICETLGVAVPTKSKRVRNKRKDTEEQPADREEDDDEDDEDEDDEEDVKLSAKSSKKREAVDEEAADESEFEGFSSDADEPRPSIEELEGSDQEDAVSKYADLLGGSSDEDEEEFDEELLAKYRGTEKVNLDDISISGSGSEDEGDDEEDEELESITGSRSPSPLPTKKSKKSADNDDSQKPVVEKAKKTREEKKEERKKQAAKAAAKTARSGDSTFLPTLMGGYISGSESASDIEAPPKKRRGQRARQAIWEKKYGANAKHLQKAATKGGRDAGWDMKRGAVGPEDQGRGKPWKRGGRPNKPPPKPTKKDNEGPLHPSWEARKKAKEAQKSVAFTGQKVVFD
ncbi:BUD22 domain-containing protein [Trichoderma breve]|uniref:BUD22 domain-containing protein n=1 Tax=Trichoderma breve TaxID=2034170 RepID=A0A9W9EA58_9HYPO|nr:BUD22 domain-containing protein [Trichoderma breve]KAJ4861846.1 BUD22 domain-containing protein [Trichoderma breve]